VANQFHEPAKARHLETSFFEALNAQRLGVASVVALAVVDAAYLAVRTLRAFAALLADVHRWTAARSRWRAIGIALADHGAAAGAARGTALARSTLIAAAEGPATGERAAPTNRAASTVSGPSASTARRLSCTIIAAGTGQRAPRSCIELRSSSRSSDLKRVGQ
jgi:hypothetical protein